MISNNNIITLNRGDTFSFSIDAGKTLTNLDTVYLGFTEPNQRWEDALIKKIGTTSNGTTALFTFSPADTENILPGKYYYEIKLVTKDSTVEAQIASVTTLRSKTIFYII